MTEFAERIKEYGTVDKAPQIEGSEHVHVHQPQARAPTDRPDDPARTDDERRKSQCPNRKRTRARPSALTSPRAARPKHAQAFRRHILTKKPTKRTRNLRKAAYLTTTESKTMKKLLPYK